jgi:hypothetical protein
MLGFVQGLSYVFTYWMFLVFFSEEMLPLTGAEMRKYLAELERSKNPDGYVSSGAGGVSLRRLKRKESGKGDTNVIEVEDVEGVGQAQVSAVSPASKKTRTSRGTKPSSSRPPSGKEAGASSLNDEVVDSFWHSEFDIHRYAIVFWLSLFCVLEAARTDLLWFYSL